MSDDVAGPSFRISTLVGANLWTSEKSNVVWGPATHGSGQRLYGAGSLSELPKVGPGFGNGMLSTAISMIGSFAVLTTLMSLITSRRLEAFVMVTKSHVSLIWNSPALPMIWLSGEVSFASKWTKPVSS